MEKKTIFVFKGIVFNNENKILIANRKEEELKEVNGKWELPGGKMEFGETPEDTVKREVFEETGYTVEVNKIIPYTHVGVLEYPNCIQHTVIFSYICSLVNDKHIEKNDHGINTYKWITYDEISQYNFLTGAKEQIESAIKNRN